MLQAFQIIILVFSAIIHEYMHGFAADKLGDSTARDAGRLTLNPIPHIDPLGSILVPALLIFSGSPFVLGWAKPVPFNPFRLRKQKYGPAIVAAAGPLGNLILALMFGLFLRFFPIGNMIFAEFIAIIVYINLILMVFNLLPIPPLDGSRILGAFLPRKWQEKFWSLDRYGLLFVILFVMIGGAWLFPAVAFLFKLLTGLG